MLSRNLRSSARCLTSSYFRTFASEAFDVAVIGGGPGGYVAAIKAAQLGLKTACIEKRTTLGGTCLNVGCIPSKALLNVTHQYWEASKNFSKYGINIQGLSYDLDKIQKHKEKAVTGLTKGIEGLFAKNKVTWVKGYGKITAQTEISVEGNDGKNSTIQAKNIVIATGSEPTPLPFVPFDEKIFVSSTGALAITKVPKHMIVIGGGVIGLELGSVWKRLGTEVTVVEFMDRITASMDSDLSATLHKILVRHGMKIQVNTKVVGARKVGDGAEVEIQPVAGGDKSILKADLVLISTGRRPFTDKLGLKEVGVKMDERGRVAVNEHLQTNIPNIYAIGDVIQGPMLAHKAEEEGICVAERIAGKGGHVNYNAIPAVIYTHPEVASVGRTEEELKKDGVQYSKGVFPFMANSRARTNDDYEGLVKILTDKQTDRILGIHIIGPNAGEMIGEGVLGMEYGAAAEDIARTCHAHPTLSEAFKEACMAAYGKPIHF